MKHRIDVSPEMVSFVGAGAIDRRRWPADPMMLRFTRTVEGPATMTVAPAPVDDVEDDCLVFVIAAEAVARLFPTHVLAAGRWHLSVALRAIGRDILDGTPDAAGDVLRLAKSIELFCQALRALDAGTLVPVDGHGELSALEAARVMTARRLIDERWSEKLTLDAIARASGLNRARLTRGFRLMFDVTIADALTRNRLDGARKLLLATDLPVSSIGYRCGYHNNASFTRAFSRRFGLAPTQLRLRAA